MWCFSVFYTRRHAYISTSGSILMILTRFQRHWVCHRVSKRQKMYVGILPIMLPEPQLDDMKYARTFKDGYLKTHKQMNWKVAMKKGWLKVTLPDIRITKCWRMRSMKLANDRIALYSLLYVVPVNIIFQIFIPHSFRSK